MKNPKLRLLKAIGSLCILMSILGVLLFIPAGTLRWPQAWVLIVLIAIFFFIYIFWAIYKDPAQTQERSMKGPNVKRWDKVIMGIYSVLLPTVFVIAGLDVGRLAFSTVKLWVQFLGWGGLVLSPGIIFWTITTNTYLSRYARIQNDRGQSVVVSGPYRFIRHPMYLGIIVLFLSIGPALGSYLAIIPGLLIDILFVIRTAREDKMLRDELAGYSDYAEQVRYRLIPGIW
jgi:protein-S-isoprenylcysteine O-methyltransferase Ste14